MNRSEKQTSNIKGLLKLIKENPTLEIVPMVDNEVCGGDDFGSWMGSWGKGAIDEVYHQDDRIYFRSTDEDEISENIFNHLEDCNPSWSDSYLEEKTEEKEKEVEWEKVIVVRINTP
jgi:hypothetical protein